MTVEMLIKFLSEYPGEVGVTMLQCADDNPLSEDVLIKDVVSIKRADGGISIVLIPE